MTVADRIEATEARTTQAINRMKQAIAPYTYPRAMVFVDKMPRTQTGKLQRFKLQDLD